VKALSQVKQNITTELNLTKDRVKALEASGRVTQYQLNFANSAFSLFKQQKKFEEDLT